MRTLLTVLSLAVLGGCATVPPGPTNYATRYAPPPADPSQWHVVSVTPVPPGTAARVASNPDRSAAFQYSSEPIATAAPRYVAPPMYAAPPVYLAQPLYYAPAPAYYPPVSIGLDFMFGRSWGGRHGRNFGGIGIGTRWPR